MKNQSIPEIEHYTALVTLDNFKDEMEEIKEFADKLVERFNHIETKNQVCLIHF